MSEGQKVKPEQKGHENAWVITLDYPSYEEELAIVKATTSDHEVTLNNILTGEQIVYFQSLIRKIPIADNVVEYAVNLVTSTRPGKSSKEYINEWIDWGAGPRASQYLIIGAKCHAAMRGKYSPDIEDVKAVALPILRHRLVKNYKAEAEGYSMDKIIESLL